MTTTRIQNIDLSFGDLLRHYRRRVSLTQRQLYDLLEDSGCDYREKHGASLISRYETGQRKPPKDTVDSFERILGVPGNLLLKAAGYISVTPAPDTKQELGEKTLHEQRAREKRRLIAPILKWRRELTTFSPVQLLQDWMGKAHEDAVTQWYYDKDVAMLYQEAGERDGEPLDSEPLAQAQSESLLPLLKQRFPDSEVWDAASTWSERKTLYIRAFHQMLKEIEDVVVRELATFIDVFAEKGIEDADWIACAAFPGFEKRCRFERLLTVLVACDALALGITKRPSKPYQAELVPALRDLRLRTDVELSAVTNIPAKGGWVSGIVEVWEQAPERALDITSAFLDRLAELQSAEEPIARAVKQLESEI
ncbi:MAG: helix-turn-helix domain-containing protein [Dehalococcoidia bacterium]